MLKSVIFTEERNISVKIKPICFKINNKLQFCKFSVFSIFEIAFQNANFEIANVVVVVVVDPTPPTCCQQSPAPEIMWQPAVSPPRWQGKAPLCRDSSRGPG